MRPDQEPGFWNECRPPASAISELVQRPLSTITADAIVCAYYRDSVRARQATRKSGESGESDTEPVETGESGDR